MEFLFSPNDDLLTEIHYAAKEKAASASGLNEKEFSGTVGSMAVLREPGKMTVWVGVGNASAAHEDALRKATATATRKLSGMGIRKLCIQAGLYSGYARAIVEGACFGAYRFNRFKTRDREDVSLETLCLPELDGQEQEWARQGAAVAETVRRVRDNANMPPNMLTPEGVARMAEDYARRCGATLRIRNEFELQEEGFGGLIAVGSGSENTPRFILLEREVDPEWPTVAIVGKTITFDSGGISIKPAKGMEEEKWDKSGGMAALGILDAVTALRIPVNMIVALCAAENMPGRGASRPGDVINIYGGTSVEVIDTDAEGRLVLADGLSFVRKHFSPDLLIDLATLTGACVVALGQERSGLFTNDDELAETFHRSGENSGDRCWRLPLGDEFTKAMESEVADLRNYDNSRNGGASKAAAFLQHFAGESRWVHIDIAGPAMPETEFPYMERGATGAGVTLVAQALESLFPQK